MPAKREYLIRISKRKNFEPHRSDFVNRQRAITLSGTYEFVTPQSRLRWHVTDKERTQHNIVCRPGYSYRGARRRKDKFVKNVEKRRLKIEKRAAQLRLEADASRQH